MKKYKIEYWRHEHRHYQEENNVLITDAQLNNPDMLKHQDHVFFHIAVLQNWINQ